MIKEKFNLTGKVAIITGASKGIGEAMARGMAEFGATVVISSRKQAAVDAVAEQFQSEGLAAIGIECHVANAEHREALVEKVMAKLANKTKAEAQEWFATIEKEGIRYVTDIFI